MVQSCPAGGDGRTDAAVGPRCGAAAARLPEGVVRIAASRTPGSASAKQTVAGVTKSGKYVTLSVQLSIESCRVDRHVGMSFAEATNSLRCGDEAEKTNADATGPFQGAHR